LADESRFRVVRLLATMGAPLSAGQLSTALGCEPNHISRHLHVLEAAGLTRVRRVGRFRQIMLRPDGANESLAAAVLRMPDSAGQLAGDLARLLDAPKPGPALVDYSDQESGGCIPAAGESAAL
jgi:predicted ArsR family transcriptional regulator